MRGTDGRAVMVAARGVRREFAGDIVRPRNALRSADEQFRFIVVVIGCAADSKVVVD